MDKALLMIGMAKKAGKVTTGEFLCSKSVKEGQSALIIIASDISDRSRKDIINSCEYYGVKYIEYADSKQLGKCTGVQSRAVVSVNDERFAQAVLDKISAAE